MKKLLLAISVFVSSFALAQQNNVQVSKPSCPVFYLGASTGVNSNAGMIGINADLPVAKMLSVGAGVGASIWGSKTYAAITYYFNPCYKGWAVSAGITHSSGLDDVKRTLHTTAGKEDVSLDLHAMTNVYFVGYRYWNIGRRGNRFYLMLGWSAAVTSPGYKVLSGQVLTQDQKDRIKAFAPGGLVIGTGFYFAFHSRN